MNAFGFVSLAAMLAADPTGSSLRGTVLDADGKPVAGARVDLPVAAPKVGTGLFCPSCYRDCAKSVRTGGDGRFEFRGLDPTLKFRVLVTAPGKQCHLTKHVDPLAGELRLTLKLPSAEAAPERTLLAQIVDDQGNPVAGALVDPYGAKTAERRWWGVVGGVDPAVSDTEGNVNIALPANFEGLDVKVAVHGYAGATVPLLKPGVARQRVVVPAGTRVTGRLVRDGRPAADLRVAVVQKERTAGHHFIKAVGDVTDADGRFTFDYLPAGEEYAIFSLVGDGPQPLVLATRRFMASADRQSRDLGDLPVIPALRIAGRIEVPAGATLPAGVKVVLDRDPAWDLIAIPVGADGTFAAEGLPPETYEVRVVANGFVLDATALRYQALGEQSFGVRLRESVAGLRVALVAAGKP